MSSSKAPTDTHGPSIDVDPFKLNKLALRVEEHLKKFAVYQDPKHLDPSAVLVAEHNRLGAPPNVPHVHRGILQSMNEKGFDPKRPQQGVH